MTQGYTTAYSEPANKPAIEPAVAIPLTVLATVPDKLQTLANCLSVAAAMGQANDAYSEHKKVVQAYDDAYNSAYGAIQSLDIICYPRGRTPYEARTACEKTVAVLKGISTLVGNIRSPSAIRATLTQPATLKATIEALSLCGQEIRTALRPLGF